MQCAAPSSRISSYTSLTLPVLPSITAVEAKKRDAAARLAAKEYTERTFAKINNHRCARGAVSVAPSPHDIHSLSPSPLPLHNNRFLASSLSCSDDVCALLQGCAEGRLDAGVQEYGGQGACDRSRESTPKRVGRADCKEGDETAECHHGKVALFTAFTRADGPFWDLNVLSESSIDSLIL